MSIPVYYSEVYIKDNGNFHGALAIRGPQGPKGDKGDQGDKGDGIKIDGVSDPLPSAASHSGEVWLRNILPPYHLYYSDGTDWIDIGTIQGEQGPQGEPGTPGATPSFSMEANVSVNNTSGTPSGTCVLDTVGGQYKFNFTFSGIKGEKGDTGNTGGQGPKGDPFTYADFTVAQLEALRGPQGIQGEKGDKGDPGTGIGTFYYTPLVLISNTEPQNPVDNLLYVQNDSNVDTGFVHVGYTTDKPTFNPDGSSLATGDVYIMQGDINQHPLLWGNIKVYPIRVWVYDGSQWVAKNAKSYVNNQWYPLNSVWLIDRGVFVSDYTNYGGKITTENNSVKIDIDTNYLDFYFTFGQPITENIKIHIEGTLDIYDVQSHAEIVGFASHYPTIGPSDFDGTTLTQSRYDNFVSPELSLNNSVVGFTFNYTCELNIRNLWYEII